MRPIPRTRHLLAVLIFAGASVAAGYMAMLDDRLSKTQIGIASVAAKRYEPELFADDPVFGESGRWRFHTPFLQSLLEVILLPTGYQDLTLPFRAMTGVAVMIYLSGMYALLYRQTRSWSLSAFVAVLSSTVTYTLGRSYWGIGSLASITPPTLVLATIPLIVLSYLRYERQWRVLLVFAFIGVCGNLHLVTAVNLTIVLLIVYLARGRFAPSVWPMAIACALCSAVASLPYAAYYLHLRYAMAPSGAIAPASVYEAFRVGNLAILYPDMLKDLLYWLLLVLVLLIPAVAVLSRVERFRVRDLSLWVWFAGGAFFVSLVLHGACQVAGILRKEPPPFIDFARASSLVMLPLYVLFAQALTNLFRLVRVHRGALRCACAVFLAAWMIPSDNLRVARHIGYEVGTIFMEPDRKPPRVQELRAKRRKQMELEAIAHWARSNTDKRAGFLTSEVEFRMMSRRTIVVSSDDVKYYYYVTPWELREWIDRVNRQKAAMRLSGGRVGSREIVRFVEELSEGDFKGVTEWYAILPAKNAPQPSAPLHAISPEGWGEHYRLYRVR